MFGLVFDKAKGVKEHGMANPRAPQRREPLGRIFEPIPERFHRHFPARVARGDYLPVLGQIQPLPDGTPGGVPLRRGTLMEPLAETSMARAPYTTYRDRRNHAERTIQAQRFLMTKEKISLLQLHKPAARDAATSLRWKPGTVEKPAPPVPYLGGFTRIFERNFAYPKDTTLSMEPIETLGTRWPKETQLPNFSAQSSALFARPKTL
jgi:hypothetical protein